MLNRRRRYEEKLRERDLPPPDARTLEYLHHIVDEGTLGANNHVRLIQDLFLHLSEQITAADTRWRVMTLTRDFVEQTRGADTPIISNAMNWLLRGIDRDADGDMCQVLEARIRKWAVESKTRTKRLVSTGKHLLADCSTILLFDYSSTVSTLISAVCAERRPLPKIVVFESRSINGGLPYLRDLLANDIRVTFLPDVAIDFACSEADAVLLGVESFRCDGSLVNTIGSRLVARTATQHGAKVYGCCDFFKLDLRSYDGTFKNPTLRSFSNLLAHADYGEMVQDANCEAQSIDTTCPELEVVPPEALTGFITERGFVPPQAVWQLGRAPSRGGVEALDE